MTIARASTAVDTEKRYPAGIENAKARADSDWREIVHGSAGMVTVGKYRTRPGAGAYSCHLPRSPVPFARDADGSGEPCDE